MKTIPHDDPDASWMRLHKTLEKYDIALFLGAGVSYPNDIPGWSGFVAELGCWSTAEMGRFSSTLSLISLCEIAKRRCLAEHWTLEVRQAIYSGFTRQVRKRSNKIRGLSLSDFGSRDVKARARARRFFEATNPVLFEIVKACGSGKEGQKTDRIGAVLTTNIDALPQLCDRAIHGSPRKLRTVERASAETAAHKIPLYQLHGYLSPPHVNTGNEAADLLVLTEDEYVERNDNPYSWANVTLHWAVREFSVVFVGCSMADELIRRALHRSCRERLKAYSDKHRGKLIKKDVQRRHFAVMRLDPDDAVNCLMDESAETLGVWPLWVRDFRKDLLARVKKAVQFA